MAIHISSSDMSFHGRGPLGEMGWVYRDVSVRVGAAGVGRIFCLRI